MKKIAIIILIMMVSMCAFSQSSTTPDTKNWKHTGTNEFTKALNIMGSIWNKQKIDEHDALVVKDASAVQLSTVAIMKTDSVNPTAGSYTSRYDFEKENPTNDLLYSLQKMGSDLKGIPTCPVPIATSVFSLVNGTVYGTSITIPQNGILTGIHVVCGNTVGDYTPDAAKFNGFVLYSTNGTTLTKVAETSNSSANLIGDIVQGKDIVFTTPLSVTAGVYYAVVYYNNTAQVTAPSLSISGTYFANHPAAFKTGASSQIYFSFMKTGVTTLQSSFTLSTCISTNSYVYMSVY